MPFPILRVKILRWIPLLLFVFQADGAEEVYYPFFIVGEDLSFSKSIQSSENISGIPNVRCVILSRAGGKAFLDSDWKGKNARRGATAESDDGGEVAKKNKESGRGKAVSDLEELFTAFQPVGFYRSDWEGRAVAKLERNGNYYLFLEPEGGWKGKDSRSHPAPSGNTPIRFTRLRNRGFDLKDREQTRQLMRDGVR